MRGFGRGLGAGGSIVVLRSGLGEPPAGFSAVGGGTCIICRSKYLITMPQAYCCRTQCSKAVYLPVTAQQFQCDYN